MILVLTFALISFLFSLWGGVTLMLGIITFLGLPMISAISRFKSFSRFFLKLAALPLRRAAFVVSEHNDIYFKQMSFDSLGVEVIDIDGEEKVFEDPDNALHHWLGISFALADEEHGVLFDPRHAALGKRKQGYDNRGEGEYLATEEEWEEYNVSKWKPGTFEFPRLHEMVNLSHVQALVDGGERSEYARRVEELYQHSRAPFESGSSGIKYLMPIIAFAMTFGGIWVMSSQLGGPDSTVSYFLAPAVSMLATLPLLGSADDGDGDGNGDDESPLDALVEWVRAVDWGYVRAVTLLVGTPLAGVLLLYSVMGPIYTFTIVTTLLLGMAILPLLTILASASAILGGMFSKLYFKLGFLGFRQPVFEWTPAKYQIREYDQVEHTDDVTWYSGFGSLIGFSFAPGPESWGADVLPHHEIEAQRPVSDGGETMPTNLPATVFPSTEMHRDSYGGYLPKRVSDNSYYLHSGIALNRFANSATGMKSLRKLLEAKEQYGTGNEGMDDATVFKATLVSGFLGALAGIAIFLLPAFM